MKKSLFYTGKMPWWLIGVSVLMGSGVLIEPQMISTALAEGNLSGMWMMWSGMLTGALGVSFFAHLWRNLPVKTENELLLYRFSGRGARILHGFRALYVGGFVVLFILASSFLAFSNLLASFFSITRGQALMCTTGVVVLSTFFNSLRQRIRMDFVFLLLFTLLFIAVITAIILDAGGFIRVSRAVTAAGLNFSLLPSSGTMAFNGFLVYVLLQWWISSVPDMPDMNGQKLMSCERPVDIVKSMVLPGIIGVIFGLFQFILPFIAFSDGFLKPGVNPEQAYLSVFTSHLPPALLAAAGLMFFIAFLSLVMNNLNWAGSLLIQNFYRYNVRPKASESQLFRAGMLSMVALSVLAGVVAWNSDSLFGIARYIFTITAGVGPVYILRWYWWRINAWSQLSSQITALIMPTVFDLIMAFSPGFSVWITDLCGQLNMEIYPFKIIAFSVLNCCVWLSVTFLTKPDDEETLRRFASMVKPGGFWPRPYDRGQLFASQRMLAWLLFAARGLVVYLACWSFVCGEYGMTALYLSIYAGLLFVVYRVLKRVNGTV